MKLKLIILILFLVTVNNGETTNFKKKSRVSVGLSLLTSENIYKGIETKNIVLPFVMYETERIYFKGIEFGIKLKTDNRLKIDFINRYNFAGYEPDDSIYLSNMQKKENTLETGISINYILSRKYSFNYKIYFDVLNNHKSYINYLIFRKMMFFYKKMLSYNTGIEYIPEDYSEYYYGVQNNETKYNRPEYFPGNLINYFFGMNYIYLYSHNINFILNLNLKYYDNNLYESPIIDKRKSVSGILGIIFKI